MMANQARKATKEQNFTDCETDYVEARKGILFGGLSSGVSNRCKMIERQNATNAVNAAGSECCTMAEIEKKMV